MQIRSIQNFKINKLNNINKNVVSNSITNTKVSFAGEIDTFEKQNTSERKSINHDKVNETLSNLDERLEKLLIEGEKLRNKDFASSREKLFALQEHNTKLEQLRIEYKKIREIFDTCKTNEVDKWVKVLADILRKMEKMNEDKGFNRIVGYDDIKNDLKNKFIFDSIIKDKVSDKATVPNAMLFYGPTGNGKTTFAIALAEQALMTPYIVNASKMDEEDAINLIEKYAKESKKNYDNSNNKQRSIIIVNEAEPLCCYDSPVLDRFKNLIKDCSQEYKCTLFLTTNHPLHIDKNILSKDITPFKVPVAPPDDIIAKKIIDKKLKQINCELEGGTQKIIDELFKNPNTRYSNADIIQLINSTIELTGTEKPTIEDFLQEIQDGDTRPSLTIKSMNKFQNEMEQLK